MAEIGLQEVTELAMLARLRLSTDETETMRRELQQILTAMDALAAVPTEGVAAMTHAVPMDLRLRPDAVMPSLTPAEALAAAPATAGDHFVVPAAIGPHE
ncbi:MAG TPA: Asp-tRNA(Asn)/Glu-tRNA(Gln) amidotransferase subunit GatC [Kofleriaceae bacterium]|nr:Asp-tRNA(Asn)/Glu-tRNA(Gln) amidotransferase subunit GatC [Kofleriaceae bacterium]